MVDVADELKVTLGVEIDPAGMANVKSELDSLKNSKDNKIEIEFKSQSMAGFSKNIASLRKDIDALNNKQINIDVNTTALNNLQNLIGNINQQLSNLGQNIANAGNNAGSSGSGNGSGRNSNLWINGNIPVGPAQLGDVRRYQQELDRMADSYSRIFGGSGGTLDSRSFKYDIVNDSATAVLKFNDAIGDTHNLMVKLNDVSKGNTSWNVVSQSFSQNLGRQTAEIDRSLDKLSEYQIKLDKLKVSASSGSKPLSEGFADTFNREAQVFQNGLRAYSSLVSGPDGTALDASQIRDLNEAYNELANTLKVQRDLQWTGSKLNATDISSQIKEYSAKINELKNDLSNKGIGDVFKTQINDLSNQLNTQVQNGTMGITEWKSKLQELKASIQEFQSSNNGKAQMLAFDIDTNQVKQIEDLLMTIRSVPENLQGSGVAELKNNLNDLLYSYSSLSAELKGSNLQDNDLGRERLADLRKELTDLDSQLKQASNATKIFQDGWGNNQKIESFLNKSQDLKNRFEQLKQRYEEFVAANPSKANDGIERQLDSLSEKLQNIDPKNIDRLREGVSNVGREINNVVTGGQSLSQILQQSFGGVGQYLSRFVTATFAITKGIQTIKSMVNEVKSLDTSLMELQKVTDLSGDSLNQFTDKAYNVGKTVGRTGKDVVDAVTTFSRAGYNLDESTELAKSALVMSNVGVDIPNMESAASDMISIMKAFDVQAEDSMSVIDKLYNVANKEPLDFGNITTMLVTAGGTLAQTNTTLEETMGLLTGGFATLRDNSVANGLIQISQRLRGVKEDGTALEVDFIPKLKKAFGDAGVEIENDNGELRSTFDILSDLAGKWDELSTKQKQFLGEKAAGNRQVKVLNAIMANWDVVTDTIEKANEATGAATEGNEKYLNSIEGRITAFKSAFQDLARVTIQSDFIKDFVGFGTEALKITKDLGGLVPILTTIVGIIGVLKGAKIAEGIQGIGLAVTDMVKGLSGAGGLTGLLTSLPGAVGALMAVAGVAAIAINAISKTHVDLSKQYENASESYSEEKSKLNSINSELENTKSLMSDLESKGKLTIVEQDQYEALKKTNDELERQKKIQEEQVKIAEKEKRKAAVDLYRQKRTEKGTKTGFIDTLLGNDERYSPSLATNPVWSNRYSGGFMGPSGYSYEQMINDYIDALPIRQKQLAEAQRVVDELVDKGIINPEDERLKSAKENVETLQSYVDEIEQGISDAIDEVNQYIGDSNKINNPQTDAEKQWNELFDYRESLYDALLSGSDITKKEQSNYILNKYKEQVKELQDYIQESGKLTEEALLESFPDLAKAFADKGWTNGEIVQHLNETFPVKTIVEESIKSLSELIDSNYLTSDSYKTLTTAMTEQQKAGTISMATYKSLVEANSEYADLLEVTAEGYALNTKAVEKYIEKKTEEQKIEALLNRDEQLKKLEELKEKYEELAAAEDIKGMAENDTQQRAVESEIEGLEAYIRELDNARSALSRFKEAQASSNEDANYKASQDVYDVLKTGNKTGKRNTDEYQEAMNYILGDNWEQNLDRYGGTVKAAQEFAEKQAKLYSDMGDAKDDVEKANKEKKAANELFKNMAEAGFGNYDKSTGSFSFNNENQSLDEIGAKLGLSADYVRDILKMANTYANAGEGFTFDFLMTDEERAAYEERKKEIAEQTEAIEESKKRLEEVQDEIADTEAAGGDTSSLKKKEENLQSTISSLESRKADLEQGAKTEVDTMSLEEAKAKIDELYSVIQTLNGEGIKIPVDIAQEYNDLLTSFPQLVSQTSQPIPITINADGTVEVQSQIETIKSDIEAIEGEHKVTIVYDYQDPYGLGLTPEQFNEDGTVDPRKLTDSQWQTWRQRQQESGNDPNTIPMLSGNPIQVDIEPSEDSGEQIVSNVQNQIDSDPDANIKLPSVDELSQIYPEDFSGSQNEQTVTIEADTSAIPEQIESAIPENEVVDVQANVQDDSMEQKEGSSKWTIDLDTSALDSYDPNDKSANVKFGVDHSAVDSYSPPTKKGTVVYSVSGPTNATGTDKATEGISLVDEKGPELIEHTKKGTYELGTDQGPRLTNLEAGDVVHTAEETRKIMSRIAKVGGFFRNGLNKAKAFFGNAYATGVSGGISGLIASVTSSGKKKTSGSSSSSSSSSSSKKWKKWLEKLFDWAEIRLKRLQTVTNAWLLSASEAVGYMAKNKELTNALSSVQDQIEATTAAYDLYLQQAELIAQKSKLADDIVQKIQDGSIEIGEYDKKIQEKIKAYSTWCRFFTPPWAVMLIENSI